jgi:hypothetical protein
VFVPNPIIEVNKKGEKGEREDLLFRLVTDLWVDKANINAKWAFAHSAGFLSLLNNDHIPKSSLGSS